jgi:ATP-dependent Clp protease ATP-binding subunit ClpC
VFERFTDRARRVVVLAQEQARSLNHDYIGTEHELLGLIQEGEGVAARALQALGISLESARGQVREIIGTGQAAPTGHIPFTPRAKKVLELALRESLQFGHNYIGTEHILLGLIREGDGVGAQVLLRLGADLNRTRQTVIQLLSGYTAGSGEMPGTSWTPPGEMSGTSWTPPSGPLCASCTLPLEGSLTYRTLHADPADEEGEPIPVTVVYCGSCGAVVRSLQEEIDRPRPTDLTDPSVQED